MTGFEHVLVPNRYCRNLGNSVGRALDLVQNILGSPSCYSFFGHCDPQMGLTGMCDHMKVHLRESGLDFPIGSFKNNKNNRGGMNWYGELIW